MDMLHIPRCVQFSSSINRPNLFYRVFLLSFDFDVDSCKILNNGICVGLPCHKVCGKSSVGKVVIDNIVEFIQSSYPNGESGIVYCFSRKECEQVLSVSQF